MSKSHIRIRGCEKFDFRCITSHNSGSISPIWLKFGMLPYYSSVSIPIPFPETFRIETRFMTVQSFRLPDLEKFTSTVDVYPTKVATRSNASIGFKFGL